MQHYLNNKRESTYFDQFESLIIAMQFAFYSLEETPVDTFRCGVGSGQRAE